jgi:F0F1-type ATP synthase membrane subunit b/b'
MGAIFFINLGITGGCLLLMVMYFNHREKKLQDIAVNKLKESKISYLRQLAFRKVKEKQEIEKLKGIVKKLEEKHRELLLEQKSQAKKSFEAEREEIIKKAQLRAAKIEQEAREEADNFVEEQKKEVQAKMVDLVMGVTKKLLTKSLKYKDHLELIEEALQDMEGEEDEK